MSHAFGGPVYVLVGALLWSTGGVCIKLLGDYSWLTISSGRSSISALVFLALCAGRVLPVRSERIWAMMGAFWYATVVCSFVAANHYTTAANAIILQYTSLLWIAVLGWVFVRELPTRGEIAALVLGGIGVVACMHEGLALFARARDVSNTLVGDAIAFASGLGFGVVAIILRKINKRAVASGASSAGALQMLFWGNALAAAVGGPALVREALSSGLTEAPNSGWPLFLWLGMAQLAGGYWFFQQGLRTTRALAASLLSLIEPVMNPVWVFLVVGERPARGTLVGVVLILGAIVVTLRSRRSTGKEPGFTSPIEQGSGKML